VPPGSAEDKRWNELCAKLPVRYSPHVGLVFDNLMPDARDASPRWAASSRVLELEGKSSPATAYYSRKRPVGAVVKAVVAGGPVALRMAAMPPTHPGWVGGGGGGVGGGGAGSAASRNLAVDEGQRVVEPGDVLVDVDGQDVDDSVSLSRVLQLLAGEAGTPVTLMFRRYSSAGGGSTLIARNFLTVFRAPSAATAASRANADSQTCQPQREIGDGSEGRDGISISTCKDPSVVRFAYESLSPSSQHHASVAPMVVLENPSVARFAYAESPSVYHVAAVRATGAVPAMRAGVGVKWTDYKQECLLPTLLPGPSEISGLEASTNCLQISRIRTRTPNVKTRQIRAKCLITQILTHKCPNTHAYAYAHVPQALSDQRLSEPCLVSKVSPDISTPENECLSTQLPTMNQLNPIPKFNNETHDLSSFRQARLWEILRTGPLLRLSKDLPK
jgi:hypothetical protein